MEFIELLIFTMQKGDSPVQIKRITVTLKSIKKFSRQLKDLLHLFQIQIY